jgi:SAM-dependent methyltransferase
MRREEYRAMFDLEEHLWWYEGMRVVTSSILRPHMLSGKQRLLDVGCGTGYSIMWLGREFGADAVFGIDASADAAVFWSERGLKSGAVASVSQLPFLSDQFDLITCFDVLYQLTRDDAAVAADEIRRVLKPGGLLFIREPAYDWLRAGHDVAVGTSHRYTLGGLRQMLEGARFSLKRATYANTLLLWAALPHRLISKWKRSEESDVKPVPLLLNRALLGVLKLEARLLGRFRFPFGLSCVVVAQKPLE